MAHDHSDGHDHGHGNGNGHGHRHHPHVDPEAGDRRVALAVAVNLLLTVAQILGGVLSGSLALIADAIHNLSDAATLVIAFAARRIARRGNDEDMTFGYARAEIVAALVNYTSLILISVWLAAEGVLRLFEPPGVQGWAVIVLAGVALAVDLATAALTFSMSKDSMNIRAAFLHNLADAMTSVAVIVAGTLILLYDWRLVDPLVTLGISAWILWHAVSEVGPVVHILMLGRPPGTGLEELRARMETVPGVVGVHHLHFWQLSERRVSVEAHIVIEDARRAEFPRILQALKEMLARDFGIEHSTLQFETPSEHCDDPTRA